MVLLLAFLIPFLGKEGTIWLVLVLSIVAYFSYNVRKKQSYWKKKGIKHAKPKFLLGNIEIIRSKPFSEKILEIYNDFPDERYYGAYQFTEPVLVVKDPDLIKQITVKQFDHFVNHRVLASPEADPFFSKNLISSRDERWRDLRATLSPSFTSSKMRFMYTLIDECAQQFIDHFRKEEGEIIELEMKDTLTRYTNDVIATTAFGLQCNSLKDRNNDFYLMGKDGSNFGGLRSFKFFMYGSSPTLFKLLKIKLVPTYIVNFFSKIIEDTVTTRKEKKIVRPDMIHLLLEAQKRRHEDTKTNEDFSELEESKNRQKQEITLEDICSQAFVFFLAGFESVATFLTFAFYELAVNPDIQKRLRDEVQIVDGKITYEALLGLKYMDMVVSEVLRKWPPAILTDREINKKFTIQPKKPDEKTLVLEEGMNCWIPIFAIHRDEKFYPDPEKFDPERFNEENKATINPSVYLPFGAGPRNCIGSRFALLEGKLLLYYVLKNFEVVTTGKTKIPVVLDKKMVNPAAEGGMWLGFKKL